MVADLRQASTQDNTGRVKGEHLGALICYVHFDVFILVSFLHLYAGIILAHFACVLMKLFSDLSIFNF